MRITQRAWCLAAAAGVAAASAPSIFADTAATGLRQLAAKELQRYLYILSPARGRDAAALPSMLPLEAASASELGASFTLTLPRHAAAAAPHCIHAADKLSSNHFSIGRVGAAVCLVAKDEQSMLHGVYSLLEGAGVHFTTAGAALPHVSSNPLATLLASLPDGDAIAASPAFTMRGLQPFHDFSEGPDWWSEDEHKRVYETIAGMKGNMVAFHTYPVSDGALAEPAVWHGLVDQVNADGTVTTGYPTSWSNTLRSGAWGYSAAKTSDVDFFTHGTPALFEHDCFGHPVQSGDPTVCPLPATSDAAATLFNRVGALWQAVFPYAHQVGVQTMLGTETPISPPPLINGNGTLTPLMVWYSASRDDHFVTTTECAECNGLYSFVGVEAWVYAGSVDGAIPLTTYYNGDLDDNMLLAGNASPPAGYGFVRVEGYALPPGTGGANTTSLLQMVNGNHHWAAAGAGVTNATADGFTSTGSIADVFTTGPPVPTSQDWYEGTFLRLKNLLGDSLDYYWVWTPEEWEWSQVNISNPLVQDVVKDTQAIVAAHAAINPSFALAACGWVVGPLGARWYFDTVLPSDWILGSIDMDVGRTDVDPAYANITHRSVANKMVIPWSEEDPFLTAPQLWVNRTLEHCAEAVSYGVGSLLNIHWRTRMTGPAMAAAHAFAWNPALTSTQYWASFTQAQFGSSIAAAAAAVFESVDSFAMPAPVNWINGPGGLQPDATQCSWASTYTWVDTFTALRPILVASIVAGDSSYAQLEAFDYWAYQFLNMRATAVMQCDWSNYNGVITAITKITDPVQRQAAAQSLGYAARISLVTNSSSMMYLLLSSLTGVDTLGTLHNIMTHSLFEAIGSAPTATLMSLANVTSLPAAATVPTTWDATRAPRLRVLTVRSMLAAGEPFRMRAIILTTPSQVATSVTLYTRAMGSTGAYTTTPLAQAAPEAGTPRFVYTATLTPPQTSIEWYIAATLPANTTAYTSDLGLPGGTVITPTSVTLYFPPDAPTTPQTVVLM